MANWLIGHLWSWWRLKARSRTVPLLRLSLSASRLPRRLTKHFSSKRSFPQLRPSGQDLKGSWYSEIMQSHTRVHTLRHPDFNVLDLGFFSSIQALQYQKRAYDVEQFVAAVVSAYSERDSVKLNKCFLTLHSVLEQAMLNRGGNEYQIPHLRKDKWLRLGDLPLLQPCSSEAVDIGNVAIDGVIV
ncbi:hypothetical protein L914_10054 [Phytophthora nicotianae]|uniref:Uncharacterized protein n=1 Tax=Phytophthora nicotianae TaxID=4792 RepID=W2NA02_PHYNI|nr:hypothetical protein L914_10054 [Phytophthora nicotianae]